MGKRLIIKGANFSENGVSDIEEGDLTVVLGTLSVLTGENFGRHNYDSANGGTYSSNQRAVAYNGVYVPAGVDITLSGLNQLGSPALRVDGCYYNNEDCEQAHVVGDIHGGADADIYSFNADGANDSITIRNIWGDYWFKFAFARGSQKNTALNGITTIHYAIAL